MARKNLYRGLSGGSSIYYGGTGTNRPRKVKSNLNKTREEIAEQQRKVATQIASTFSFLPWQ
jgi:hypothetical protein